MSEHAKYQDSYQIASDWLNLHRDRLVICSEATGDKHTLVSKLDRAQDLTNTLEDGRTKIDTCVENAEATQPHTGSQGKQSIQHEVDSLKLDWSNYESMLTDAKAKLEDALNQWKVRRTLKKYSHCNIKSKKEQEGNSNIDCIPRAGSKNVLIVHFPGHPPPPPPTGMNIFVATMCSECTFPDTHPPPPCKQKDRNSENITFTACAR